MLVAIWSICYGNIFTVWWRFFFGGGGLYCNEISPFVHTRQSLAAQSHYAGGCQEMLTEICYSPFTVRKHNQITDICDLQKKKEKGKDMWG